MSKLVGVPLHEGLYRNKQGLGPKSLETLTITLQALGWWLDGWTALSGSNSVPRAWISILLELHFGVAS